jgi:hypothetical protein
MQGAVAESRLQGHVELTVHALDTRFPAGMTIFMCNDSILLARLGRSTSMIVKSWTSKNAFYSPYEIAVGHQ